MADTISTQFRKYNAGAKWRNTPIGTKSKIDYSKMVQFHPDNALNQEYIDAGAADDRERPLCWAVHSGVVCRRPARKGARFCWKGRGDD